MAAFQTCVRGYVPTLPHGYDQHNVVKLTDQTGAVLESYDYSDYGQPEFFDPADNRLTGTAYANPYLFTGRRWDDELGYYPPPADLRPSATATWTRPRKIRQPRPPGLWGDPMNMGNGYTYAGSNPWSLVDPYGLAVGGMARVTVCLFCKRPVKCIFLFS